MPPEIKWLLKVTPRLVAVRASLQNRSNGQQPKSLLPKVEAVLALNTLNPSSLTLQDLKSIRELKDEITKFTQEKKVASISMLDSTVFAKMFDKLKKIYSSDSIKTGADLKEVAIDLISFRKVLPILSNEIPPLSRVIRSVITHMLDFENSIEKVEIKHVLVILPMLYQIVSSASELHSRKRNIQLVN